MLQLTALSPPPIPPPGIYPKYNDRYACKEWMDEDNGPTIKELRKQRQTDTVLRHANLAKGLDMQAATVIPKT